MSHNCTQSISFFSFQKIKVSTQTALNTSTVGIVSTQRGHAWLTLKLKPNWGWIDRYCHLDRLQLNFSDISFPTGFRGAVAVFCNPGTYSFSEQYGDRPNNCVAIDLHLKNSNMMSQRVLQQLRVIATEPKTSAFGEICLDYRTGCKGAETNTEAGNS